MIVAVVLAQLLVVAVAVAFWRARRQLVTYHEERLLKLTRARERLLSVTGAQLVQWSADVLPYGMSDLLPLVVKHKLDEHIRRALWNRWLIQRAGARWRAALCIGPLELLREWRRPTRYCECGRENVAPSWDRFPRLFDGKCSVWPFCRAHRDDVMRSDAATRDDHCECCRVMLEHCL